MADIWKGVRYSGQTKGLSSRSAFEKRHAKKSNGVPLHLHINSGSQIRSNEVAQEYIMDFHHALARYAKLYNGGIRVISKDGKPCAYRILTFEENPYRKLEHTLMDGYQYDDASRLGNADMTALELDLARRVWSALAGYLQQAEADDDISLYADALFHVLPEYDARTMVALTTRS